MNLDELDLNSVILLSNTGMGNGSISNLYDVVYIKRNVFDKSMTPTMALEVEAINEKLATEGKNFILIGPGRWGTRDRWIGIPVTWPQISNAKVIVETSLDDFPLDASSGSHFFHNVISMNVGYCSVPNNDSFARIAWSKLDELPAYNETKYFRHVRFPKPLQVKMDGTQRLIVVTHEP